MPGFRFSLQQLLDLRSRAEDSARCRLARSQQEAQQHRVRLEQLEQACSDAGAEASAPPGRPVQPGMLLNADLHRTRLRVLAAAQQERVTRSCEREQEDRESLLQTSRHRQVVERLKDRRYEQYLTERSRTETRQMEEAGTMAFLNRRAG